MRIGCLQFAPQVGDVDNNLNRADSVLSKANPDGLDLLVLPEMAFSGYNFKSLQHISAFLEPSGSGITSLWARTTALKYNCNVVVGYPEKADVSGSWPTGPEYYNSAIVVNEEGETIANYRKSFLYYTDETWALEGDQGFYKGYIPGLGLTSIGICMDLNPYKFEAPWHAFEFAFHILEHDSNLVIVSMAWMTREDGRMFSRMPNEPDMDTLTYWVTRLEPLIRAETDDEIIVVFCNRTGIEDDAVYAGTSAVVGVLQGEVRIYGLLGRDEKELLVVDTNNPPYAKLVYRPEVKKPSAAHSELQQTGSSASSSDAPTSATSSQQSGGSNQGFSSRTPTTKQTSPPGGGSSATTTHYQKPPQKASPVKQNRALAKIQIPHSSFGSMSQNGFTRSPGSESIINLPTPTAPSPTPLDVRPKLTIPELPPSASGQDASPAPQSAQSTHSVRSNKSIKSNPPPKLMIPQSSSSCTVAVWQPHATVWSVDSFVHSVRSASTVTSNGTILSNPRPPEDSTPYPGSSLLMRGYPGRFSDKISFEGAISMSQTSFTPITPFDEPSPLQPRYFWHPSHNFLSSPMETGSRSASAEPADTGAGNFSNFSLCSKFESSSRTQSSNGVRTPGTAENGKKFNEQSLKGHHRAPSRGKKPWDSGKARPAGSPKTVDNMKVSMSSASRDVLPARHSPSKSRNASRSRTQERSDSSSARCEQVEGSQPDRPPSPKSRNCSRSRPSKDLSSIPIAPNSNIVDNDVARGHSPANQDMQDIQRAMRQRSTSMSRVSGRTRARSATDAHRHVRSHSGTVIADDKSLARPPSRNASRGRQPGPRFSPPKMVPHDPSQPDERARGDWVFPKGEEKSSVTSKGLISAAPESKFEGVAFVMSPNHPIHERNPTGSVPALANRTPSAHRVSEFDIGQVHFISHSEYQAKKGAFSGD